MARKSGLGKGLDSLISTQYTQKVEKSVEEEDKSTKLSTKTAQNVENEVEKEKENSKQIQMIRMSEIEPNREQPRKNFGEDALEELAESIRQIGVIEPLLLKPEGRHYVIIAGERRWRAARKAGLREVPAVIRDSDEREILEISLIENIERQDLNVIEEAEAYQKLIDEFGYRQEDLARRLSRSRTSITNRLRLLNLSKQVREMLQENRITEGHARALLALEDENLQIQTAEKVIDDGLSVRDTEKLVKKMQQNRTQTTQKTDEREEDQFVYDQLEEELRKHTGTKVTIQRSKKEKGKIVIDYYSSEELERLMDLFRKM